MGTSKITSKGQLTIPQEIREKRGLKEGTDVVLIDTEEGVLVKKASDLKELFAPFRAIAKKEKLTRAKLAKTLIVERNRTIKRLQQQQKL